MNPHDTSKSALRHQHSPNPLVPPDSFVSHLTSPGPRKAWNDDIALSIEKFYASTVSPQTAMPSHASVESITSNAMPNSMGTLSPVRDLPTSPNQSPVSLSSSPGISTRERSYPETAHVNSAPCGKSSPLRLDSPWDDASTLWSPCKEPMFRQQSHSAAEPLSQDEFQKKERRRANNRIAAQRARERRKRHEREIVAQYNDLLEMNRFLVSQVQQLQLLVDSKTVKKDTG